MDADELAAARKKRMMELQQAQEMEAQIKSLLQNALDQKAYERAMNVRLANPELYSQLVQLIAYLYRQGQIRGKVSEEQLVQLLNKLRGGGREPTITVKRKD